MKMRIPIYLAVPFLFFLSPGLFAFSGININNGIYALLFVLVIVRIIQQRLLTNLLYIATAYIAFILIAIAIGFINGYPAALILKEALYYFKPILFLFYGYLYIRPDQFQVLIRWSFWFMLVGSIVFFLDPVFFITKAIEKSPEGEGFGHFYAYHQTVLRNSSLLLSPLESGYTLFFLCGFIFIYKPFVRNNLALIVAVALLLATFARSTILALLITYVLYQVYYLSLSRKILFLGGAIVVMMILVGVYFETLANVLVRDGSAVVHMKNLFDAIAVIFRRVYGYGIGYSGFGAFQSEEESFYSEGSLFTFVIETGLLILVFGWIVYYSLLRMPSGRRFLFIYFGYLCAALLIPIGFSTIFNLLFFSYYGIIIKHDAQENSHHLSELEHLEGYR